MMRAALTLLTFVSVIVFPWPFTALLAVAASSLEPLLPLAAGIFTDTLYYSPQAAALPFFAIGGAIVTAAALLVRSRLRTGPIR